MQIVFRLLLGWCTANGNGVSELSCKEAQWRSMKFDEADRHNTSAVVIYRYGVVYIAPT